jgi:WD40 repeat protein
MLRQFGETAFQAEGGVLALAYAPDGTLHSIEEPGILRAWSAQGQLLQDTLLSELEALWAFGKGGTIVGSASDDLAIWDSASGRLLLSREQPSWITSLALSDDLQWAVTGSDDGAVRVWSVADGEIVHELQELTCPISAVAFDPTGKRIAAAGEDKTVALWDLAEPRFLGKLTGHSDRIHVLAWHKDGKAIVSGGWDSIAWVWDVASLAPIILLNAHALQISALAFSPDGTILAAADSDNVIHLWDFQKFRVRQRLSGHSRQILSLSFSVDGSRLASGGEDSAVQIWDVESGKALTPTALDKGIEPTSCALAMSPDGTELAMVVGSEASVWQTGTADKIWRQPEDQCLRAVAYSCDGRWLAGGARDGRVHIWERPSRTERVLEDPLFRHAITCLAFSPDSSSLAVAGSSEMAVWLWGMESGQPELLIPDPLDGCGIETLAFHPGRRQLAIGGIDALATGGSSGAVAVWDLESRSELAMIDEGTSCIAFHPSGKFLACSTLDRSICIWDLENTQMVRELPGHQDPVARVAYSRDGAWLASGGHDRILRLWDADFGALLASVSLGSRIQGLAFAPDNKSIYVAYGDCTVEHLELTTLLALGTGS